MIVKNTLSLLLFLAIVLFASCAIKKKTDLMYGTYPVAEFLEPPVEKLHNLMQGSFDSSAQAAEDDSYDTQVWGAVEGPYVFMRSDRTAKE